MRLEGQARRREGWQLDPDGPGQGRQSDALSLQSAGVVLHKAMAAERAGWIIGSMASSTDCSMLPTFQSCIVVADGDFRIFPICLCGDLGRHGMTACRGARTPTPGGMFMHPLRRHKHAILLAALIVVALIESFSHRQVLGTVLSDLVIVTLLLLVFLIVFTRRVNRLVAFLAWAAALVAQV